MVCEHADGGGSVLVSSSLPRQGTRRECAEPENVYTMWRHQHLLLFSMTHPHGDADQQSAAAAAAGGAELALAAAARTEPFRLAPTHLCLYLQVSNSLRQRQWEALHCAEDVNRDAGPVKAGFAPEKGLSGLNGAQVSRSCPLLFSHRRSHSRASTAMRPRAGRLRP